MDTIDYKLVREWMQRREDILKQIEELKEGACGQ